MFETMLSNTNTNTTPPIGSLFALALVSDYNQPLTTTYNQSVNIGDIYLRVTDQNDNLITSITGTNTPTNYTFSVPIGVTSLKFYTKYLPGTDVVTGNSYLLVTGSGLPSNMWFTKIHNWETAELRTLILNTLNKLTSLPSAISPNLRRLSLNTLTEFNDPSVSSWDTSHLTSLDSIFAYCTAFNQPVNQWNTQGVTSLAYAFYRCSNFNQTVASWNISRITTVVSAFDGCSKYNQDLSSMIFRSNTVRTRYDSGTTSWITTNKPKFTGA